MTAGGDDLLRMSNANPVHFGIVCSVPLQACCQLVACLGTFVMMQNPLPIVRKI